MRPQEKVFLAIGTVAIVALSGAVGYTLFKKSDTDKTVVPTTSHTTTTPTTATTTTSKATTPA